MSESKSYATGRKSAYVARNRAALLRATQEVLAEYGASATVELVADQAEIAVSTIYKHFPNKEALFDAALIGAMLEWEEWTQSIISKIKDPLERLIFPMRLMVKAPKTHPIFAHMVARNPSAFIQAVPRVNFGLGPTAFDLQSLKLLNTENIEKRVKNLIMVLTLTFVELCTNPELTEDKATAGISVALEMLGLTSKQIDKLMSAPLPEFSAKKTVSATRTKHVQHAQISNEQG